MTDKLARGDFEPPNLDAIPEGELEELAPVLEQLALYAKIKARAMRLRLGGRVELALQEEESCERIYNALPAWARW